MRMMTIVMIMLMMMIMMIMMVLLLLLLTLLLMTMISSTLACKLQPLPQVTCTRPFNTPFRHSPACVGHMSHISHM